MSLVTREYQGVRSPRVDIPTPPGQSTRRPLCPTPVAIRPRVCAEGSQSPPDAAVFRASALGPSRRSGRSHLRRPVIMPPAPVSQAVPMGPLGLIGCATPDCRVWLHRSDRRGDGSQLLARLCRVPRQPPWEPGQYGNRPERAGRAADERQGQVPATYRELPTTLRASRAPASGCDVPHSDWVACKQTVTWS
jgi:hypothetical protein